MTVEVNFAQGWKGAYGMLGLGSQFYNPLNLNYNETLDKLNI